MMPGGVSLRLEKLAGTTIRMLRNIQRGIRVILRSVTELIDQFRAELSTKGGRSSALASPCWVVGLLGILLVWIVRSEAPISIIWVVVVLLCVVILLIVVAYIYLMFTNPDALRSEKFTLQKMAIERGLLGDSDRGYGSVITHESPLLPATGQGDENGEANKE